MAPPAAIAPITTAMQERPAVNNSDDDGDDDGNKDMKKCLISATQRWTRPRHVQHPRARERRKMRHVVVFARPVDRVGLSNYFSLLFPVAPPWTTPPPPLTPQLEVCFQVDVQKAHPSLERAWKPSDSCTACRSTQQATNAPQLVTVALRCYPARASIPFLPTDEDRAPGLRAAQRHTVGGHIVRCQHALQSICGRKRGR